MDILVTGGCGYIGSALVPRLQAAQAVDSVSVLDSLTTGSPRNLIDASVGGEFTFHRGDVRSAEDVEAAIEGVDAVIHLAAITGAESTHERREETFAVNYEGATTVFEAAATHDVSTVVFASSCNIYGREAEVAIDEAVEPDPLNPYAEAKYEAEQLLVDMVADGAFDGTALRMSTNYGYSPGIRFNLVINKFVFRALTGRPLTVYGDGSNWRPFIHVEDAARAFAHAALHPEEWEESVYNVGANAENYRIEEIANLIRDVVDPELEMAYLRDEQPGPSYHVNFDRMDGPDFDLQWTLREGIQDLAHRFATGTGEGASQTFATIDIPQ